MDDCTKESAEDLHEALNKLLAKSRKMRLQSIELDAEIERVTACIIQNAAGKFSGPSSSAPEGVTKSGADGQEAGEVA